MPRKSLYPVDPENGNLENILLKFYREGIRPNGTKSSPHRDFPVEHYRYVGLKDPDKSTDGLIADKNTAFIMRCTKHEAEFETNLRKALNGSDTMPVMLCRHCGSELGYGKTLHTYSSIKKAFKNYPDFPFSLDLPSDTSDLTIFETKDLIKIRCTKNQFGTNEPCDKGKEHRLGNILSAMKYPDKKGTICCQGKCDSKLKGKSLRRSFDSVNEELSSATSGEWTLSPNQVYTKNSNKYWFTHTCGFKIYLTHYQLLHADSNDQGYHLCPCCNSTFPGKLIDNRLDLFSRWVTALSDGKLEFAEDSIPYSPSIDVRLNCLDCGSEVITSLDKVRISKHRGCKTCSNIAKNRQRVKATDSQCEKRRGFTVEGEMLTVNESYSFVSTDGEIFNGSLVDLCKKYPVTAMGIKINNDNPTEKPVYERNGQPYTEEDIAKMRELANTMSYAQMSPILQRSPNALKRQFELLGLRNDQRPNYKRQTSLNDKAFSNITPETCYWAGLIAADGCVKVESENNKKLSVELQGLDEDHLGRLLAHIKSAGKVSYRPVNNSEHRNIYASVTICSVEIVEDLERNFNIVPVKTHILQPPKLDIPDREAFMLGLFDGDGNISRNVDGSLVVGVTTASPNIAKWYVNEVKRILDKDDHPLHERRNEKGNLVYYIPVHTSEATRFLNKLYSAVGIRLDRKYSIFEN